MKHFGYSEEDYKNLSLAFSVLLDKDKVPSYVRQLPAFFYSLPRGSLKTATVA